MLQHPEGAITMMMMMKSTPVAGIQTQTIRGESDLSDRGREKGRPVFRRQRAPLESPLDEKRSAWLWRSKLDTIPVTLQRRECLGCGDGGRRQQPEGLESF